jgi:glycosyltransferase involved in cell wall biosynthesis
MRILLVCGNAFPQIDANSKICFSVAREIQKMGTEIEVLAFATCYSKENSILIQGIKTHLYMPAYTKLKYLFGQNQRGKLTRIRKLCIALTHPVCAASLVMNKNEKLMFWAQERGTYKILQKLCRLQQWDALVAVCQPFTVWNAVARLDTRTPVILYQLDPYASNYLRTIFSEKSLQKQENRAIENASHIFTTYLLKREIEKRKVTVSTLKTEVAEFPCVVQASKTCKAQIENFDAESWNLFFLGTVDDAYRSPEYLLQVFQRAVQIEPRLQMHFMGNSSSKVLDKAIAEKDKNVFYHGRKTFEEAESVMRQADVLVNIGNTFRNMMPSKILDYLSTGKPILNICKFADCPTLRFTEKYPLALNLLESDEPEQAAQKLVQFARENRGKQIPFATIEAMYRECTPAYVGRQILDVIKTESKDTIG